MPPPAAAAFGVAAISTCSGNAAARALAADPWGMRCLTAYRCLALWSRYSAGRSQPVSHALPPQWAARLLLARACRAVLADSDVQASIVNGFNAPKNRQAGRSGRCTGQAAAAGILSHAGIGGPPPREGDATPSHAMRLPCAPSRLQIHLGGIPARRRWPGRLALLHGWVARSLQPMTATAALPLPAACHCRVWAQL